MLKLKSILSKRSKGPTPGATEIDPVAGLKRAQMDYELADDAFRARKQEILEQAAACIGRLVSRNRFVRKEALALYAVMNCSMENYVDILLHALAFIHQEMSRDKARKGDYQTPDKVLREDISKESKRSRLRAGSPRDE